MPILLLLHGLLDSYQTGMAGAKFVGKGALVAHVGLAKVIEIHLN